MRALCSTGPGWDIAGCCLAAHRRPPAKVEFHRPGVGTGRDPGHYGPGGTRLSGPPVPGGGDDHIVRRQRRVLRPERPSPGDGDIACKTVATGPATSRDDHRRSNHLCGGPGRQEARALAGDHAHAGDPEGLSPPFVRHSHDQGGLAAIC
jgi:hypothetical protein